MELNELTDERIKLEGDIAVEVEKLVSAFRQKTGVSVENISMYMSRITAYGDSQEEYIVSNVSCKIAFQACTRLFEAVAKSPQSLKNPKLTSSQ